MTDNFRYPKVGIDTTSPLSLNVNSVNPVLKLTQTGSGDCFVVEDSASPDTTPFVINTAGKILKNRAVSTNFQGVGGEAELQMHGFFPISLSAWSTGGTQVGGNKILFTRSNNATVGAFSFVTLNQGLGFIEFAGATDNTGFVNRAVQIAAAVDLVDLPSETIGGRLIFATGYNDQSGPPFETMRLTSSGNVGIGTTNPTAQLHLGAQLGVADSATVCLDEKDTTPANPADGTQAKIYIKDDKLILQFNDGGTVRYKYLDLTGTGVTWVHSTTAP